MRVGGLQAHGISGPWSALIVTRGCGRGYRRAGKTAAVHFVVAAGQAGRSLGEILESRQVFKPASGRPGLVLDHFLTSRENTSR